MSPKASLGKPVCAGCGKPRTEGGLCSECYLQEHPLLDSFKEIHVEICAKCGKLQFSNKWIIVTSLDEAVARVVGKQARVNTGVTLTSLTAHAKLLPHKENEGMHVKGEADIEVGALVDSYKGEFEDHYAIPILVSYRRCPHCSKANSQYFEGVLQIRGSDKEARKYIEGEIRKHVKEGVHLTKTVETEDGADYYVTSGRFLRGFSKELESHFGGEAKLSAKLFSRDHLTGKALYRVMALLRLPQFRPRDVVLLGEAVIAVTSISGSRITGTDLSTGKHMSARFAQKDTEKLPLRETQVSRLHPHLEVLDPDTYQSVEIGNPLRIAKKPGEKSLVVKVEERLYLVS